MQTNKREYWSLVCYPAMLVFTGVGICLSLHGPTVQGIAWLMLAVSMLGLQPAWAIIASTGKNTPGNIVGFALIALGVTFEFIASLPVWNNHQCMVLVMWGVAALMVCRVSAQVVDTFCGTHDREWKDDSVPTE